MSRKDLHDILGEALRYTRREDEMSVSALNDLYLSISRKVYRNPMSKEDRLYARCMGDCVISVSPLLKDLREAFLKDAESVYKELTPPGKHTPRKG